MKVEANGTYKQAVVLLKELRSRGLDAAICGGWIRDIDNNITPKDIDICVLGVTEDSNPDIIIEGETGTCFPNYGGMNMRDDVACVIKYYNTDVDIIIMKPDTWEEVTGNFDVSICQIICKLDDDDVMHVFASDSYLGYKKGGPILRFLTIPTCDSHVQRVRDKFGKLSFTKEIDNTLNYYGVLTEEGMQYDK